MIRILTEILRHGASLQHLAHLLVQDDLQPPPGMVPLQDVPLRVDKLARLSVGVATGKRNGDRRRLAVPIVPTERHRRILASRGTAKL